MSWNFDAPSYCDFFREESPRSATIREAWFYRSHPDHEASSAPFSDENEIDTDYEPEEPLPVSATWLTDDIIDPSSSSPVSTNFSRLAVPASPASLASLLTSPQKRLPGLRGAKYAF
jgi:hypothetical protein